MQPLALKIGDEDVARRVDRDPARLGELTGLVTRLTPFSEKGPIGTQDLDTAIEWLHHVEIAVWTNGEIAIVPTAAYMEPELTRVVAALAPRGDRRAVVAEDPDVVLQGVDDEERAIGGDSHTRGRNRGISSQCDLADELDRRQHDLTIGCRDR